MKPFLENTVISFFTALAAAATTLQTMLGKGTLLANDWLAVTTVFVITFSGAVVNGLRQKDKQP